MYCPEGSKRVIWGTIMGAVLVGVALAVYGCVFPSKKKSDIDHQVVVRFYDSITLAQQGRIHEQVGGVVLDQIDADLVLVSVENVDEALIAYLEFDEVKYAEREFFSTSQQAPVVIFNAEGVYTTMSQAELDPANPQEGRFSERFSPTQFGSASVKWATPVDASGRQVIALRVRVSTRGITPSLEVGRFGNYSPLVPLAPYVRGGGVLDTTWTLVEIPAAAFATNGALNGIDRLRVAPLPGTHHVWIDSVVARDSTQVAPLPDPCPPCPACPPETNWMPNDPSSQWHLHAMRVDSTWKYHTRGDSTVVVAILDSGSDTLNAEFAGRVWRNSEEIPGNGMDDDDNGKIDDRWGWDFMSGFVGDNNPQDVVGEYAHGHGIHIAGIIGATYNNGQAGAGMDQRCKLMFLRGHNASTAWTVTSTYNALLYAVREGAQVINCSFLNAGASLTVAAALDSANTRGVVVVCAAGNNGVNNDLSPHYPASYPHPNVLTVGAVNSSGAKPSWSNWGPTSVDVGAPGQSIVSTKVFSTRDTTLTGTSQAAPMVAGACALVIAQARKRGVLPPPGPDRVSFIKGRILSTVDVSPGLVGKWVSGGTLNVYRATQF